MVTGAPAISVSCLSLTYSWGRREIDCLSPCTHALLNIYVACAACIKTSAEYFIETSPAQFSEGTSRMRTDCATAQQRLARNLKHKRALTRQEKGLLTLFIFLMRSGLTFCTSSQSSIPSCRYSLKLLFFSTHPVHSSIHLLARVSSESWELDPLGPRGWGLLGVGEGEEEESGELRPGNGEECFGVNGDGDVISRV
jgi:hypothetical protein